MGQTGLQCGVSRLQALSGFVVSGRAGDVAARKMRFPSENQYRGVVLYLGKEVVRILQGLLGLTEPESRGGKDAPCQDLVKSVQSAAKESKPPPLPKKG